MPRATSAACEALPPSEVRMPLAAWKPATSSASVNGRTRMTARALGGGRDGGRRGEDDVRPSRRPARRRRRGRRPRTARRGSKVGCSSESSALGVDRGDRLGARQQALGDGVGGEADGRLRRALGVAGLEHVQPPLLDRELGVLHVAVVALERAQDLRGGGRGSRASSCAARRGRAACGRRRRRPRPARRRRKSPLGSGAPVTSSRENATPEHEAGPRLPNTICWTLTAVPQSSGMPLIRR